VRDGLTVGRPIPGVEVKIADDGEVLARGENVTPGYWLNPKATEDAFDDGWYRTGDLGTLDERGCLYLHGRKKDMIVLSSGQKVYPQDVEQELLAVPGVLDAVVLGMPGDGGQDVYAVLIPDPEKPLVLDDAIRAANQRLAPHQRIKSGSIWPDKDFPRTFTFKVKKHEVLARLLGAETPTPQPEPATV
jgi:long-chain acyl-CoA synthetase